MYRTVFRPVPEKNFESTPSTKGSLSVVLLDRRVDSTDCDDFNSRLVWDVGLYLPRNMCEAEGVLISQWYAQLCPNWWPHDQKELSDFGYGSHLWPCNLDWLLQVTNFLDRLTVLSHVAASRRSRGHCPTRWKATRQCPRGNGRGPGVKVQASDSSDCKHISWNNFVGFMQD